MLTIVLAFLAKCAYDFVVFFCFSYITLILHVISITIVTVMIVVIPEIPDLVTEMLYLIVLHYNFQFLSPVDSTPSFLS